MAQTAAEKFELLQEAYRRMPPLYAKQVLGVELWSKQIDILLAMQKYQRVFVKAGHSVSKTHTAGTACNFNYDMYNPGLTIVTAPSANSVRDVIFKEIRSQRGNRIEGLREVESRLELPGEPDHKMVGTVANTDTAFQGRHGCRVLLWFDECVGIKPAIWDAGIGMMSHDNCKWVAVCNPTDTSSRAYAEVCSGKTPWHIITISALDHPNIRAALRKEPIPFPNAVSISFIDTLVEQHCVEVDPRDKRSRDFWWSLPDCDGRRNLDSPSCWRPNSTFECRVLGQWPSESTGSIWSDAAWLAAIRAEESGLKPMEDDRIYCHAPEIGCDVAWSNNDKSVIMTRRGYAVVGHRGGMGWKPSRIAEELKAAAFTACQDHARHYRHLQNYVGETASQILIKCDHDATGDAIREYMAGYNFVTMSGARTPINEDWYTNGRSEDWFTTYEMADRGMLDLSRLPEEVKTRMRIEAMAQKWHMTRGKRAADEKEKTRKILKGSPDNIDAMNLAFAQPKNAVMRMPVTFLPDGTMMSSGGVFVASAGAPVRLDTSWKSPLTGPFQPASPSDPRRKMLPTSTPAVLIPQVKPPRMM